MHGQADNQEKGCDIDCQKDTVYGAVTSLRQEGEGDIIRKDFLD